MILTCVLWIPQFKLTLKSGPNFPFNSVQAFLKSDSTKIAKNKRHHNIMKTAYYDVAILGNAEYNTAPNLFCA